MQWCAQAELGVKECALGNMGRLGPFSHDNVATTERWLFPYKARMP